MSDWFSTHKEGFRQVHERLVERRGFGILGHELYQNVRDTSATECIFRIVKVPGKPRVMIECEDNGPGFKDLTHAWTMYAPSEKKDDPTLAGRFNMGEKVVLSFAHEAMVHTTSGMVLFDAKGRHEHPRRKRPMGTLFQAHLACNQERYEQLLSGLRQIIVKQGLLLVVNDVEIPHRESFHVFESLLKTEIGETLRPTIRRTAVEVYSTLEDEVPTLFELGIPVVETGDKWHVSICQKVPLNSERDNVTPAYLRSVRVAVYNELHASTTAADTESSWVNEATSDDECTDDAVETFRVKKYGEKSVASDPGNSEADAEAVAHNYVLIPSRGLTGGQRKNLYRAGTLRSSTKEFPTAGKGAYSDDPNAIPVKVYDDNELSEGMRKIRQYTQGLASRLLGKEIQVRFVHCDRFVGKPWTACYGRGHLSGTARFDYNVFKIGRKWFDQGATESVDSLILHELGHDFESNHLCEEYYHGLTKLGARLKALALEEPDWFSNFTVETEERMA